MLRSSGAQQVVGDQCQYGQEAADGRPVKKATPWFSNSPEIMKELDAVPREAAVYPFKLCRAIIRGCVRQLRANGCLQPGQHGVQGLWEEAADSMIGDLEQQIVPEVLALTNGKKHPAVVVAPAPNKVIKDLVTGQRLPAELVRAARRLEME